MIYLDCFETKLSMQQQYPVMYGRLEKISKFHAGKIPAFVKKIYSKLIQFVIGFNDSCPKRKEEDYIPREKSKGEIKSWWAPNFPLKKEAARYEADRKMPKLTMMHWRQDAIRIL